jgi:hypothetical protein
MQFRDGVDRRSSAGTGGCLTWQCRGRGFIGPASGLLRRYQQRAVERIDNAYQKRATSLTANKAEVVKMRLG